MEADRWNILPLDEGIRAAVLVRDALPQLVLDVGTGSGCIAVTIAAERKDVQIIASDISEEALAVATKNAQKHNVIDRIQFVRSDGSTAFAELTEPFLLVSNPPYVPQGTPLQNDVVGFEPHGALFAGTDGMDVLRPLMAAALAHPNCHGIAVECRSEQARQFPVAKEIPEPA